MPSGWWAVSTCQACWKGRREMKAPCPGPPSSRLQFACQFRGLSASRLALLARHELTQLLLPNDISTVPDVMASYERRNDLRGEGHAVVWTPVHTVVRLRGIVNEAAGLEHREIGVGADCDGALFGPKTEKLGWLFRHEPRNRSGRVHVVSFDTGKERRHQRLNARHSRTGIKDRSAKLVLERHRRMIRGYTVHVIVADLLPE